MKNVSAETVDAPGPRPEPAESRSGAALSRVPGVAPLAQLERELRQVVRTGGDAVRMALVAVLAEGHLLIQDVPGVGKTTLAQAVAHVLDCRFRRIQFTSDLLPSDVIGVSIYNQARERFEFNPGPIFANVLLADEINRTTPKTQSALLEAMNERQVTVDNETYALPRPFWVIATQNPAEHHGTYPLPESQLDRFLLRIRMGYPTAEDERAILRGEAGAERLATMEPLLTMADVIELQRETQAVTVTDAVLDYELALVEATRHHPGLELGVSPRGLLMLHRAAQAWAMLEGRHYCIPGDVKRLLAAVCAHRVITQAQHGERPAEHAEQILSEIAATIPIPE
ncbi:MAG TPA: MoxR family ATPase [Terriglobales bacterium]|nr:MoxR family ATPase [Terriglobales bacterium]